MTDAVQEAVGQTMLYTPQQDLSDVQAVARDQVRAGTSLVLEHQSHLVLPSLT